MSRFAVTWGNPPAAHEYDDEWPGPWQCVACGRRSPRRAAVQCGECAHAWRWGWMLSLAHARSSWQSGRGMRRWGGGRDWGPPWWHPFQLRRPSKVWVCPCCSHDL